VQKTYPAVAGLSLNSGKFAVPFTFSRKIQHQIAAQFGVRVILPDLSTSKEFNGIRPKEFTR
jgi:hypothetical protein